jgi:endonuclease-3
MPSHPTQQPSQKTQRLHAEKILSRLKREFPHPSVALQYETPLQLLIATILSAQCTDERVNNVTKHLFRKYHSAEDFANADPGELEQDIHSTGFYRAKAKNIIACCRELLRTYNSAVPDSMEELIQLAGVGRKTANVVLGNVFGKVEGIVVDTHVRRLSQRLGLSAQTDPEKIEQDLMNVIPKQDWFAIGNLLILHGRKTCDARRPECAKCTVNDLCPSAGIFMKQED